MSIRLGGGLIVAAIVGSTTTAAAHPHLAKSTPAANDTIRGKMPTLRLTFTEAVDANYTVVVLVNAAGQEFTTHATAVGGSPSKEFQFMTDTSLNNGHYTVRWKAAGSDGHAVTGSFPFVVAVESELPPPIGTPAIPVHHAETTSIPESLKPESSLFWVLARWIDFIAIVLIIGCVTFRFGVLERWSGATTKTIARATDHAVKLAIMAAIAGIVANVARGVLQSGSLHGPDRMWEPTLLASMLTNTTWGHAWLIQTFAMFLFAIVLSMPSRSRSRWIVGALCAAAIAATPAFSGHANAVTSFPTVSILGDTLHVIGAAGWLGSLAFVLFAGLPAAFDANQPNVDVAQLVLAFSPVALVMAGTAMLTGVVSAFLHLSSVSMLWTTSYGKVLIIKLAIVSTTVATGAYNWRIVTPRLGTDQGTAHLKTSVRTEILVAVAVLAITAVLVGLPTP